jgi:diguanylate cyclase (GGDEF)-like protein
MSTILVAADHAAHREHMAALLADAGYRVVQAGRGDEAWVLIQDVRPDLLLTDVVLPGIDGFELAWRIAADPALAHTRIVVSSTGFLEEQARQLAEACGVSHFVGKPVQREPLVDAVRDALAHPRPAADWDKYPPLAEVREQMKQANRKLHARVKELEDALRQARSLPYEDPLRDALTGLYNRGFGIDALRRELLRARRNETSLAVLTADIDHFAQVNEGLSPAAGDALLRALGSCLGNAVRGEDVVCRYDGEQFLLLMPGACLESATERAESLSLGLQQLRVLHGGQCIACPSLSFGVAVYPEHGDSAEELLQSADAALHLAKIKGRNRVEAAVPPTAPRLPEWRNAC